METSDGNHRDIGEQVVVLPTLKRTGEVVGGGGEGSARRIVVVVSSQFGGGLQ